MVNKGYFMVPPGSLCGRETAYSVTQDDLRLVSQQTCEAWEQKIAVGVSGFKQLAAWRRRLHSLKQSALGHGESLVAYLEDEA